MKKAELKKVDTLGEVSVRRLEKWVKKALASIWRVDATISNPDAETILALIEDRRQNDGQVALLRSERDHLLGKVDVIVAEHANLRAERDLLATVAEAAGAVIEKYDACEFSQEDDMPALIDAYNAWLETKPQKQTKQRRGRLCKARR